ncbi:helix-turn-helix domain-containing protein [Nonomuraea sp. NPDC050310]|uniref:TetR/AcrR family transcriptional regulator n=1 Tax=Nonomuraea sp. NPDC050310 TaxID=3154935 RepID=UPI0033EFB48F
MRADAQKNLGKIVEAAAEVLAEHGDQAPMALIARRAGVGVGTLYRRFPDRGELLAAVGEHYVRHVTERLARAEREPDAWAALRAFVAWVADPGRGALAGALAEVPEEALAARPEFVRMREEYGRAVARLVARAHAEGRLRPDAGSTEIMTLLKVFTCHPEVPDPGRYLELMLDGLESRRPG